MTCWSVSYLKFKAYLDLSAPGSLSSWLGPSASGSLYMFSNSLAKFISSFGGLAGLETCMLFFLVLRPVLMAEPLAEPLAVSSVGL